MTTKSDLIEAFDARVRRREDRREFLMTSARAGVGVAGLAALAACSDNDDNDNNTGTAPAPAPAPTTPPPIGDADILNFALNLEYLEAQFYSFAATGAGLPTNLLTGVGILGAVRGGAAVPFTDPEVRRYANEIAADERAHVTFLRAQLGGSAVALPEIDIGVTATSAFSNAARAAGLIGAGQSFNVYANDINFLLGAYIFEDVGVTAFKGAAPLLANRTFVEASAGILAVEAYHAGLIRTALAGRGVATPIIANGPTIGAATTGISNARDALDGSTDLDQGIVGTFPPATNATLNIVPTDANAIAFSRTAGQTLNIVYLNSAAVTAGGFFPNGVNGRINASAQSA